VWKLASRRLLRWQGLGVLWDSGGANRLVNFVYFGFGLGIHILRVGCISCGCISFEFPITWLVMEGISFSLDEMLFS
jgi:hypothetical protein